MSSLYILLFVRRHLRVHWSHIVREINDLTYLRSLTGGLAYGIPRNASTPSWTLPRTRPFVVCTTTKSSASETFTKSTASPSTDTANHKNEIFPIFNKVNNISFKLHYKYCYRCSCSPSLRLTTLSVYIFLSCLDFILLYAFILDLITSQQNDAVATRISDWKHLVSYL